MQGLHFLYGWENRVSIVQESQYAIGEVAAKCDNSNCEGCGTQHLQMGVLSEDNSKRAIFCPRCRIERIFQ